MPLRRGARQAGPAVGSSVAARAGGSGEDGWTEPGLGRGAHPAAPRGARQAGPAVGNRLRPGTPAFAAVRRPAAQPVGSGLRVAGVSTPSAAVQWPAAPGQRLR